MTVYNKSVTHLVFAMTATAVIVLVSFFFLFPFQNTQPWLLALVSMLGLAVVSALFALRMTQEGATTSLDFVPHLGALLLIGPTGAATLTLISELLTQFVIKRRAYLKGTFNTAQLVLSVLAAGGVYYLLGGQWSLDQIDLLDTLIPFLGGAATYFTFNRAAVSYIVSASEGAEAGDIWSRMSSRLLAVDIVISPLAFLVAYLYVLWGPLSLLLSVLPIIALRYTYGVNIELQQLNRDLLRALVRTLEAQDPYTSGHSIRVAEGAKRIAKELGLRKDEIHNIEQAALLHDIGKVGGAYHQILQQEGSLSTKQKELVRQHPERGAKIIEPVRSLPPETQDYIKHHHERYDGSGYPDGLAEKQIPLGARVIMVADTIDAMRTDRPYRKARKLSDIQRELLRLKGKQFDPEVVDAAVDAGLFSTESGVDPALGTESHSLEV